MTQPQDRKLYWAWRDDERPDGSTATQLSPPYRTVEEAEAWARSFDQPGETSEVQILEVQAKVVKQQTVTKPKPQNGNGPR